MGICKSVEQSALLDAARLDVSIIIPCYNEKDNIVPLYHALVAALSQWKWEAVFVDDDSPDGTIHVIRKLAQEDSRVKGILRVNKRGLSSAVIEGVLSSSATCIAVIDGDMQHDETRLPEMLEAVLRQDYDFAVGSRHAKGGNNMGLANRWRYFLSDTGIWISQRMLPFPLRDPMSGFFALRRSLFLQLLPDLSGTGFKILLDLVMSCPADIRIREVPFEFRKRVAGSSKLDFRIMLQFIFMMMEKIFRGRILKNIPFPCIRNFLTKTFLNWKK